MLTYDNLTNLGLSQRNSLSKLFWLTNFCVDNIQLSAHHKMSVKTKKNNAPLSRNLTRYSGEKFSRIAVIPMRRSAQQNMSNITEAISKCIGVKFKSSLATINDLVYSLGWSQFRNVEGVVKNLNAFYRRVTLRTKFSPGNSLGWIQPGY